MANRIRQEDEKVQSIKIAFEQINIEAAAREAGVPASTLRYDLNKVKQALPETVANRKPGPKRKDKERESEKQQFEMEESKVCPECGGKVNKNGTYRVLNWLRMLLLGWLGVQRGASHRVVGPGPIPRGRR